MNDDFSVHFPAVAVGNLLDSIPHGIAVIDRELNVVVINEFLEALASMEFRQNEYVYTLMKSFGVRPVLLIMAFIVENAFLIGISFAGAVWAFMKTQRIVLGEFFKLGNSVLTYADIRQDLWLLGISLAGCVLLSSIPVAFSACRPIGKVLK